MIECVNIKPADADGRVSGEGAESGESWADVRLLGSEGAPLPVDEGGAFHMRALGVYDPAFRQAPPAGLELMRYTGFLTADFCSPACLRAAWPAHKAECKHLTALREPGA
ncbi:hypothetical protein T492DRAFT_887639 [Pavlovales sp. CCMP2436]|nr:hypothetical protein T492DRAFT_887639 [Pavlovales sp. CCMP2436]